MPPLAATCPIHGCPLRAQKAVNPPLANPNFLSSRAAGYSSPLLLSRNLFVKGALAAAKSQPERSEYAGKLRERALRSAGFDGTIGRGRIRVSEGEAMADAVARGTVDSSKWGAASGGRSKDGNEHELGFAGTEETRGVLDGTIVEQDTRIAERLDAVEQQQQQEEEESTMAGKGLAAKLGQSFNPAGIGLFFRLITGERHLALPHASVPDIRWIDWNALKGAGFEGVVLDKDNTLTRPYAMQVWPDLVQSLKDCQLAFEGNVAILSNSAGLTQYDPKGEEATALETQLGVKVIRHNTKKPAGGAEELVEHFGCTASQLVMVGDRYFTDVVYGNRNGLFTIRPAPISVQLEPFVVRRVREFEDLLVQRWMKDKHLKVLPHPLAKNPMNFIKDPGCW